VDELCISRLRRILLKRKKDSQLFELARVLVRFNHIASVIVNANDSMM